MDAMTASCVRAKSPVFSAWPTRAQQMLRPNRYRVLASARRDELVVGRRWRLDDEQPSWRPVTARRAHNLHRWSEEPVGPRQSR